ncbi:MAG TPA: hypothetical protein VF163_01530 [Micromonosporaceae bacterium]
MMNALSLVNALTMMNALSVVDAPSMVSGARPYAARRRAGAYRVGSIIRRSGRPMLDRDSWYEKVAHSPGFHTENAIIGGRSSFGEIP